MKTAAIIVAAGRGRRAGDGTPKQWRILAGRRVADWTIERFTDLVDHIVLVLSPDDESAWHEFRDSDIILAAGGDDRANSVRSGLHALSDKGVQRVLIHDVARPCVGPDTITNILSSLETHIAVAPGLAVTDALWTGDGSVVTGVQDRTGLYAAQTPQGFHYDAIVSAHASHSGSAADDVEVARAAGLEVAILPGDLDNIKITYPEDFARAEQILGAAMDVRLGNGFDVHRFGDGDHVVLCGVKLPHDRGLQGHSDADVGMHAVTDAIYGALAQGDIGRHFPPSDTQWKGAASEIFLRHAVELAGQMGFRLSNVDCTLVCEYPKIGPHAPEMQKEMSRIMGLELDKISIKATTSERLGFTGRGEGIAALATVCVVKP
ncbi:bifunctional 2-C-methyl-D-erythritol 4-phosphate cytidylyltransferase/2-C-methyl-D-erythritol 2,4-cyclodiphosphate synthase [Ruegeria arenilitoris]|uniref:bifunctional 2-C-methyl-D-erythritol 4-phosphate cytidylyltransferase/2-C-methyl-D-erythritol 2,4-cyclodiphosphate synthase n=1 Tax=Ruegeria arenilitoris TaxID=1173585 RepID=UPI0014811CDA|nr:bifunctional 2-C-methyl-D-erythritol 4-phosphate cytidylyltransferase/2-C-methyl-D-erythritol 2,4-cyclodiphosphate synthase [Ruegeria arenilitoris]